MTPRPSAPKGQWIITNDYVNGRDGIVVGYLDIGSSAWLPLCWFEVDVTDEHIIDWIINVGRVRIADEIITRTGDILLWLPIGLRVRRLRLEDGTVFDESCVVSA